MMSKEETKAPIVHIWSLRRSVQESISSDIYASCECVVILQ